MNISLSRGVNGKKDSMFADTEFELDSPSPNNLALYKRSRSIQDLRNIFGTTLQSSFSYPCVLFRHSRGSYDGHIIGSLTENVNLGIGDISFKDQCSSLNAEPSRVRSTNISSLSSLSSQDLPTEPLLNELSKTADESKDITLGVNLRNDNVSKK